MSGFGCLGLDCTGEVTADQNSNAETMQKVGTMTPEVYRLFEIQAANRKAADEKAELEVWGRQQETKKWTENALVVGGAIAGLALLFLILKNRK